MLPASPFAVQAVGASAPPPTTKRITQGTDQQEMIWAAILERNANICIAALAGTGKSSTCLESMWRAKEADPSVRIRYTCFNKSIAEEFQAKSPSGVEVGTMHSFGLKAISRALPGVRVDKNKTYTILDSLREWPSAPRPLRRCVSDLVSLAKNHALTDPDDFESWDVVDGLIDYYDVPVNERDRDRVIHATLEVLGKSAVTTTVIDFDDMLLFPLLHQMEFPSVDLLYIDECQDMNAVQHRLSAVMNPHGVTVIVGDKHQAIYGFRGSDSRSMDVMAGQLAATTLPLTMTFRCPQSHVRLAREIVPQYQAHPSNPEGTLRFEEIDKLSHAAPGDLVLCRANAPLISLCLGMIADGKRANMRGRAIGKSLEALFLKVDRNQSRTTNDFLARLDGYRRKEVARLDAKEGNEDLIEQLSDRCAALDVVASECQTPADVVSAIDRLFRDDDPAGFVTFSSIHRAKGSEARRVWFIDKPYAPANKGPRQPQPWELVQRANLRYVALTRSLDTLTIMPYSN